MNRLSLPLFPAVLVIFGCSSNSPDAKAPESETTRPDRSATVEATPDLPPGTPTAAGAPVLVTLEMRTHRVHVLSGDRFSVEDAEGRIVAGPLTDDAFAQQFPALHRATRDALAAHADGSADRSD